MQTNYFADLIKNGNNEYLMEVGVGRILNIKRLNNILIIKPSSSLCTFI